jgi:polyferredoxin
MEMVTRQSTTVYSTPALTHHLWKRKVVSRAFLIIPLFLVAFPVVISASVTERAQVAASAVVGEYQMQVFTLPNPLVSGKEGTVTLKIHRLSDNRPARDGRVFVNTQYTTEELTVEGAGFEGKTGYFRAVEADQPGNYEFNVSFKRAASYFIKVRFEELGGKHYNAPLHAGFTLNVNPAANTIPRLLFVMTVVIVMTAAGGYLFFVRTRNISTDPAGFNFLDIKWVKRIFKFRYIQPVFQVPLLALFTLLIYLAFFDIQDGGKNLSTKVIWTIWWAGVIFTFVLVGRMWCFMCPVGALSEWTARTLKPQRRFPKRLRNLWIANGLFIVLTWLDAQLGVVRNPVITGSLLVIIIALSLLIAAFYQRRTFCRYLCPIGGLIGLYSTFSAVELRSKDCRTCREHALKECYFGNENGYGCPMFEAMPSMDNNNYCNFCGECIKSCPKDNITLRVRPFFRDAWTTAKPTLDQAALAVVLIGVSIFVTGDMLEPWEGWIKSAMAAVPADLLGIEYEYTVEVITKSVLFFSISLVIIPGIVLLAAYMSDRLAGDERRMGVRSTFIAFGFMFIPIGLSMHLAHNLGHLLNESMAVVPAFQRFLIEYTPFSAGAPDWEMASSRVVGPDMLYLFQMALLVIFYGFTLYPGFRLAVKHFRDGQVSMKALSPMLVASFILMSANVYLLNLPMAPRHIH